MDTEKYYKIKLLLTFPLVFSRTHYTYKYIFLSPVRRAAPNVLLESSGDARR